MTQPSADNPAISVLMPVYNAARYLREAIASIQAQTASDFEYLCVDDGSTDESPAILAELARSDPRLRIITKSNGGVTSALNAGLAVARGEFVARMDADDIADPARFQEQLDYMRQHPECAAVGCLVIHTDSAGKERDRSRAYLTHEQITQCLWNGNSSALPHYGAFIRRSMLTQVGNYREQFRTAQDLDLFLRLSEIGKLANVPHYLMRYREHEHSVGATKSKNQAANAREILRQAYARKGMELPEHLAKWSNVLITINRSRWAWAALEEGRHADARGHAWNILKAQPLHRSSWHLALHAALGPLRPRLRSLARRLRGAA
jgi:glycosyltransferase involved in cell wall biosynthesis